MAKGLRIGQLARRFGLNPKTIRYYEDLRLLPKPKRTESGYRLYDETDAARLNFIGKAKRLGLSLQQIKGVLAVREGGEQPCQHVVEMLDQQIAQVDRALAELTSFHADLTSVRDHAASLIPEGAVCGIIEHQTARVSGPPAYLRGQGLSRAAKRTSSASREHRRGLRTGEQRVQEPLDFDLDWKV